jgi:hypothetical protein
VRIRTMRRQALALRCSAVVGAAVLTGLTVAPAADAGAYANVLTNSDFSQGGTGNTPTGWSEANLDNEANPYSSDITSETAGDGSFPPPVASPAASGYSAQVFYEGGSDLGSEGIAATQGVSNVSNTDDPQVGYTTLQTVAPGLAAVDWAGTVFEVDFTSGPTSYELRYYNSFAGVAYPDAPSSDATTKYIVGPSLAKDVWFTQAPRDLNADILAQFGLSTYTVTAVDVGVLEDTINPNGAGYPNETAYFTDADLASDEPATPPAQTPESPLVVGLPVAGVVAAGGAIWLRYRRRSRRNTPAAD